MYIFTLSFCDILLSGQIILDTLLLIQHIGGFIESISLVLSFSCSQTLSLYLGLSFADKVSIFKQMILFQRIKERKHNLEIMRKKISKYFVATILFKSGRGICYFWIITRICRISVIGVTFQQQ